MNILNPVRRGLVVAVLVLAPAMMSVVESGEPEPQPCGGLPGTECAALDEFCKFPLGECCCDVQGVCTSRPLACPDVWDPVCGCDGVTYSNECESEVAGVSVAYLGTCGQACGGVAGEECAEGEYCRYRDGECCCDQVGVCRAIPGGCPAVCDPVCGCDGVTYANPCEAAAAEASIEHPGPCFAGGGLIQRVRFNSPQKLTWAPHPDALSYNVYVKRLQERPPLDYGECLLPGVNATEAVIPGVPESRHLWWIQVTGNFVDGEGPMGSSWVCTRRAPSAPCFSSSE